MPVSKIGRGEDSTDHQSSDSSSSRASGTSYDDSDISEWDILNAIEHLTPQYPELKELFNKLAEKLSDELLNSSDEFNFMNLSIPLEKPGHSLLLTTLDRNSALVGILFDDGSYTPLFISKNRDTLSTASIQTVANGFIKAVSDLKSPEGSSNATNRYPQSVINVFNLMQSTDDRDIEMKTRLLRMQTSSVGSVPEPYLSSLKRGSGRIFTSSTRNPNPHKKHRSN